MKIINPATNELIKEVQEDSLESIQKKYDMARSAQKSWAERPMSDRIQTVAKFWELLKQNLEPLAQTLTSEMGKPITQSRNEIKGAGGRINFFVENSERWLSEESMLQENGMNEKIVYEPLGVIGNISAWNYPYLVGVNVFIPALIAGNAVLYKPSGSTTLTGLEIGRLLHKADVPEYVFQVVVGGGKIVGGAMIELPLDGYFFTGSNETGQYIYERVAKKMVPCQMELGGKDPLYVSDGNKNVKSVAAAAADGAFYNNGQSCCAVERIYVHQNLYDDFIGAFVEEVKSFKIGDPMDDSTYLGAIVGKQQLDFLQEQVDEAVSKGAKILIGGGKIDREGNFFEPTVLIDVDHSMGVMKDETFGPVIGIMKVNSDEEAVSLMNDTEFGLTSSVFSDNPQIAEKILKQINSGTVYWNCCDRLSPNLPWSGRNHSGIGITLSYHGIRAFVKPKAYHLKGTT